MATSGDVKLRIGAESSGLSTGLNQSKSAIRSFANDTRAVMGKLGTAIESSLDRMMNPITSLLLGGGLVAASKGFGDLSNSLMYYQMTADKTDAEIAKLRKSLHALAIDTGYSADEIQAGMSQMVEFTGDVDFSEGFVGQAAKIARASKSTITDIASVGSSLKASLGLSADEAAKVFNMLIVQGDRGAYALEKMSQEGRALIANAAVYGVRSTDQLAGFMAMLQVANSQIKSEAELTTAVSRTMDDLIAKRDDLSKMGVQVFDKDGARDFETVIREVIAATGGDLRKLGDFSASSKRLLQPLIIDYKNGFQQLNEIKNDGIKAATNTDETDKRFEKTRKDFNTNIQRMRATAREFVDTNLSGPIDSLNDSLKWLAKNQEVVSMGFRAMKFALAGVTAVKFLSWSKKVGSFLGGLRPMNSGNTGGSIAESLGGASGVQKVFVVNMGAGLGGVGGTADAANFGGKFVGPANKTGKEMNKFRGLLNRLGGTQVGFGALSMATSFAIASVGNLVNAFMEWRKVTGEVETESEAYVKAQQGDFRNKYGNDAAFFGEKIDQINLEIQKRENSFWNSLWGNTNGDERYAELIAERAKYTQRMRETIRNPQESGAQYMQNFKQDIYVSVERDGKTTVETRGDVKTPPRAYTLPGAR